jgi:hypothetical protein
MLHWSIITAVATALFWTTYWLKTGSVPLITQIISGPEKILHLPFPIPHWIDVLIAPMLSSIIIEAIYILERIELAFKSKEDDLLRLEEWERELTPMHNVGPSMVITAAVLILVVNLVPLFNLKFIQRLDNLSIDYLVFSLSCILVYGLIKFIRG